MFYWRMRFYSDVWDREIIVYFSRRANREPAVSEMSAYLRELGEEGRKVGKIKKDNWYHRSGSLLIDAASALEQGTLTYTLESFVLKALP
jgi:hypothetical protein